MQKKEDDASYSEHRVQKNNADGEQVPVNRRSALSALMSDICDEVYSLTPVINNEAVNKNTITGIAQNSRNKVVTALLRNVLEPNLGFTGNGQEVSVMRSTLLRTGVWTQEGGIPEINLHPAEARMRHLLETIEQFVLETRSGGQSSFSELYERLTAPEYHIGIRLGVIPIYLAAVLHHYRQQTIIHDWYGPVATSADVLLQINAKPEGYLLEYLDWNAEKEEYVARLAEAFSQYVVPAEKSGNSFDYVANAMRRWYMALPRYTKECRTKPDGTRINKRRLGMLKLLRENTGGSDLLFKKLPQAFGYPGFDVDVADAVISTKGQFDALLDELKRYLILVTKETFLPEPDLEKGRALPLMTVLRDWSDSLDPKSFEQLFSDGTERFLKHVRTDTNDEDDYIARLAKLATGLRLEDWDERTVEAYKAAVATYKRTARAFHSSVVAETIGDTAAYQIVFADEDGRSTTRRFDKVETTKRGKLLFNQITAALDGMGQSISEQEKRQTLMEILKKLC